MAQGGGKVWHCQKLFCVQPEYIYIVVAEVLLPPQALIPLTSENTDVGKVKAAQALAKITITSNPEIAFPGERVRTTSFKNLLKKQFQLISCMTLCLCFAMQIYETVRPLVSLLSLECTLLQNFEALMALTNLAGISERLRLAASGRHFQR